MARHMALWACMALCLCLSVCPSVCPSVCLPRKSKAYNQSVQNTEVWLSKMTDHQISPDTLKQWASKGVDVQSVGGRDVELKA